MPAKRKEINVGDKFNHLTIVSEIEPYILQSRNMKVRKFLCKCICNNEIKITISNLISGSTKSCGCMKTHYVRQGSIIHELSKSPEYHSWRAMKARCLNSNHHAYYNYGGRGITIHQEWIESFQKFYNDMGNRPTLEHTLDRIDNNGNYEPNNCKWSTKVEQCKNRRIGIRKLNHIEMVDIINKFNSKQSTVYKLADEYSVTRKTIYNIINKRKEVQLV
jgi:hypothetical protein